MSMRRCEKIGQPGMLSSSRKNFALRTRYKRSPSMGDTLGVYRESAKTGRKATFSHLLRNSASLIRGAAPETPRFIALGPESLCYIGAAHTAPPIPASGSTLRSHLCVALSSAQRFSEWKTSTQPCNDFPLNGCYPLNLLSHSKGSLQRSQNGIAPLLLALPASAGLILANRQIAELFIGSDFRQGTLQVTLDCGFFAPERAFHALFRSRVPPGEKAALDAADAGAPAALNRAMNLVLIPRCGDIGAAYSTLCSYILLIILSIFLGRWVFPLRFPIWPAIQITGAVACMAAVLKLFTFPIEASGLIAMIGVGCAVYALSLLAFNVANARTVAHFWLQKRTFQSNKA